MAASTGEAPPASFFSPHTRHIPLCCEALLFFVFFLSTSTARPSHPLAASPFSCLNLVRFLLSSWLSADRDHAHVLPFLTKRTRPRERVCKGEGGSEGRPPLCSDFRVFRHGTSVTFVDDVGLRWNGMRSASHLQRLSQPPFARVATWRLLLCAQLGTMPSVVRTQRRGGHRSVVSLQGQNMSSRACSSCTVTFGCDVYVVFLALGDKSTEKVTLGRRRLKTVRESLFL